jgi:hypothetical protein
MMLKNSRDIVSDRHGLHRIAQQVPHHPHITNVR